MSACSVCKHVWPQAQPNATCMSHLKRQTRPQHPDHRRARNFGPRCTDIWHVSCCRFLEAGGLIRSTHRGWIASRARTDKRQLAKQLGQIDIRTVQRHTQSMTHTMEEREFDIVVFGASGFTGVRVLRYLCSAGHSVRCGYRLARHNYSSVGCACRRSCRRLVSACPSACRQ